MIRQLTFPDGFRWGVATSSHQNEGNNTNNDFWEWEQNPDHIADRTTSGLACDWWGRAEADFDRASELGVNALRMSVEWSRLEPQPGVWDSVAFDRYREMLKALRRRGMEPMVTLHHFTNPRWLAERGGWTNPRVVTHFAQYVGKVVQTLGDLCQIWCTINEPNIYSLMTYIFGQWPPGKPNLAYYFLTGRHHLEAHAAACQIIHDHQPQAQVGIVQHIAILDPANPTHILDKMTAALQSRASNWGLMDSLVDGRYHFPYGFGLQRIRPVGNSGDFIGLNYYGRSKARFDLRAAGTGFGQLLPAPADVAWPEPWAYQEIYPDGLLLALTRLARYGKSLYVTENGLSEQADLRRPGFLLSHLAALRRAIQQGIDVRGYFHWTLVDNYEWTEGWEPHFGLIELNPQTQQRTPRGSFELYRQIVKANAITEEMVSAHAPHLIDHIFTS